MPCTAPQHASNGAPPAANIQVNQRQQTEQPRGNILGREGRRANRYPLDLLPNLLHDALRFSRRPISVFKVSGLHFDAPLASGRAELSLAFDWRVADLTGEIRERDPWKKKRGWKGPMS
jgi:hypothetical protein